MITLSITGSISTNDAISASYISASNIDGIVSTASFAVSASYAPSNSGGGINGMAYFTSSTTWTIPEGIKKVRVIAVGGGGGGTGGPGGWTSYGGGGGGFVESVISVEGYTTLPVWVGNGGAGHSGGTPGEAGGHSGILHITASGGNGAGISGGGSGGAGTGAVVSGNGQSGNQFYGGCSGTYPWIPQITLADQGQTQIGYGGFGLNSNGQRGGVILYY